MSLNKAELENLISGLSVEQMRRILVVSATKFPQVEVLVRTECGSGPKDLRELPSPDDIKDLDDIYALIDRAVRCIRIGDAEYACSFLELVTHRSCTDGNILREIVGVLTHHQQSLAEEHTTASALASGISSAYFFFLDLSSYWKECLLLNGLSSKRCRRVGQSLKAWQHALTNNVTRLFGCATTNTSRPEESPPASTQPASQAAAAASSSASSASRESLWNICEISSVFNTAIAISEQKAQTQQQRDGDSVSTCSEVAMSSVLTSLDSLPDELVELVLVHLPGASLASLGSTCRRMRRMTSSDSLWMVLHERDKFMWTAAGSVVSSRPHAAITWRQRYVECANYPRLTFNVQTPRPHTMLETFMGGGRKVDRIALLGSQGSHKQKVLGFLLSNPRCGAGVTPAPPLSRNMTNGREWLAGLERPGVSLEIVGTPVYLTILSTLMWPQVFRACSGLVYVLSSQMPTTLLSARDELHRLLNVQSDHQTTPLLVLITDKGTPTAATPAPHPNQDTVDITQSQLAPALATTTTTPPPPPPFASSSSSSSSSRRAGRSDSGTSSMMLTATTSPVHVAEFFGLYALQRQWRVQYVDLNTFTGVLEGFKWLCFAMRQM